MSKQREDPKLRHIRKLTIVKLIEKNREKRDAIFARLRGMKHDQRKSDFEHRENSGDMAIDDSDNSPIIDNLLEIIESYESIMMKSIDWDEFISNEEFTELYNEIEATMAEETHNFNDVQTPDEENDLFFSQEELDAFDMDSTESILCPICWRSFLVCDKAGYALHCPSCALTISLVQDPIVGTAITSAEYKQLLARSYDRFLDHRESHRFDNSCCSDGVESDRPLYKMINNNLFAKCPSCELLDPVL